MSRLAEILVTNDDGIFSPGLRAAVEAVLDLGEVVVVAPRRQQTSMGRSLQANPEAVLTPVPFKIRGMSVRAYHCECSPAMAVRHGMRVLYNEKKPDLVVSGINYGENLGINISTSGTIGAALEGASHGVPALAVSKQTDIESHREYTEQNWNFAAYFLKHFSKILLSGKVPIDVDVLKIDIPETANERTPWRLTRLARQPYYSSVLSRPSLKSRISDAKTTIDLCPSSLVSGTDIHAFTNQQAVSVTPLSLDLTSRINFEEMCRFLEE